MDKKELQALLDEVAAILGGTAVAVHDWSGYIDLPSVNKLARIYFRVDRKKLVIDAGTNFAKECDYYLLPRPDSISVSWERGATIIAKEIQRRLLHGYRRWIGEVELIVIRKYNSDSMRHARAHVLRNILGDKREYNSQDFTFWRYDQEGHRATEGAVHSDNVHLEMRVTFDEAKAILRMIVEGRDNA